jgi:hypothetical protein
MGNNQGSEDDFCAIKMDSFIVRNIYEDIICMEISYFCVVTSKPIWSPLITVRKAFGDPKKGGPRARNACTLAVS